MKDEPVDERMDQMDEVLLSSAVMEDLGRLQDEEENVRQLLDSLGQAGLAF